MVTGSMLLMWMKTNSNQIGVLKKIVILPIKIYQWVISPLLGQNCRHEPTCSNYTIEAINEWGIFKGTWLGIVRLSKCHPWGTAGYDPVPRKKK